MTTAAKPMKITRLVPWFGANADNAHVPAEMLKACTWVAIPFAGSMCEVPHFRPGVQILVSDLHDELLMLARVVGNYPLKEQLAERLSRRLFHPGELDEALKVLREARSKRCGTLFGRGDQRPVDLVEVAEAYFVASWMGRNGIAGTTGELRTSLALRYDAGGGDPVTRFRSAVASLDAWNEVLERCQFTRESAFDVLERLRARVDAHDFNRDKRGNQLGLYCDPPWPDDGEGYQHGFTEREQRLLAAQLSTLPHVRICVRFGDHPLIREIYRVDQGWAWNHVEGRTQTRSSKAEVFLTRNVHLEDRP